MLPLWRVRSLLVQLRRGFCLVNESILHDRELPISNSQTKSKPQTAHRLFQVQLPRSLRERMSRSRTGASFASSVATSFASSAPRESRSERRVLYLQSARSLRERLSGTIQHSMLQMRRSRPLRKPMSRRIRLDCVPPMISFETGLVLEKRETPSASTDRLESEASNLEIPKFFSTIITATAALRLKPRTQCTYTGRPDSMTRMRSSRSTSSSAEEVPKYYREGRDRQSADAVRSRLGTVRCPGRRTLVCGRRAGRGGARQRVRRRRQLHQGPTSGEKWEAGKLILTKLNPKP